VPVFLASTIHAAVYYVSYPIHCNPDDRSMSQQFAGGNYESAALGDRFGLGHPPTILARTSSVAPIGFTRLKSQGASVSRSKDAPVEDAYIFHVQLQPAAMDMWVDGKLWPATTTTPGTTFLYDLRSSPVAEMHSSFDNVRFYISQASLDELAYDQGMRRTEGLVSPCLGSHDRVMYGLANALLDHVERANEHSALFIDHIALAFHAHVMRAYGKAAVPDDLTPGGLSPWQLRRVLDFLSAHLSEDPTVAELARECALSSGYFARAFRRTTGVTPHQWLIRKRVERARGLLLGNGLGLADIALVCGFVDQSHFTRVFTKLEGDSPGRWRQRNGKFRQ
jgi:AraC family transcriptional regulator